MSAKLYELEFSIDTLVDFEIDFEIDTLEASAKLYARSVRETLLVDFSIDTLVASAKLYELIRGRYEYELRLADCLFPC